MSLAKPISPSNLQAFSLVSWAASNATITCTYDALNYSLISPLPDNNTCASLVRGVAAVMDISSNDRSVVNILWSCLATIFACTWISLHPNIPHPTATEWHVRRHRFSMMVCGIIAPEMIVLFALREWLGARTLVKRMKKKGVEGFTLVHGHFMLMGGFMLYSNDGARVGIITECDELQSFIHRHEFTLPTEDEIRDRSKGDGLSKTLVVGQCGWFILQLVSRWINGLAITEVELVTLAFAALNGIIYFFWWQKPLNVRYGVHVDCEAVYVNFQADAVTQLVFAESQAVHDEPQAPGLSSQHDEPPIPTSNSLNYFSATWTSSIDHGTFPPVRVVSPDISPIRPEYQHDDLVNITNFLRERTPIGRLLPVIADSQNQKDLQASMFHIKVSLRSQFVATLAFSVIGILFGAIHLIAWNFHFLTPYERTSWRVFSIVTTASPAVLCVRAIWGLYITWHMSKRPLAVPILGPLNYKLARISLPILRGIMWITSLLAPFYVASRCGLLIQSLVALRHLGPEEKSQIRWIDLIPHL